MSDENKPKEPPKPPTPPPTRLIKDSIPKNTKK